MYKRIGLTPLLISCRHLCLLSLSTKTKYLLKIYTPEEGCTYTENRPPPSPQPSTPIVHTPTPTIHTPPAPRRARAVLLPIDQKG